MMKYSTEGKRNEHQHISIWVDEQSQELEGIH